MIHPVIKAFFALCFALLPLTFAQETPTPTAPLSDDPEVQAMIERLLDTPVLYNVDTQAVKDIFQRGHELGNRADIFTKIGDSNTTSGDFLQPIAVENECQLGDYSHLQATIDYFSISYDGGESNSFTHTSVAAQNGLSSNGLLDPMWAGEGCEGNENPVACEYRRQKPSIAIMMIGLMDTRYDTDPALYHDNLEAAVQYLIEQGVIPVLTTIIVLPDQETLSFDLSIRFDAALLDIADEYQIPLINLWAAVQDLPDFGIGPDRTHLKQKVGVFCDFTGAQDEIGSTLRNLLTLQALDAIRETVQAD
jgi:hypothetical protein